MTNTPDMSLQAVERLREDLTRIRSSMALLQQNSEGCAACHYGNDGALHGMPRWLLDTRADLDRLTTLLATPSTVTEGTVPDDEPVAYLHTMHMEGGQTYDRLTAWNGVDEDEPMRTAFGFPGYDYSQEYSVTTTPLYASPKPTTVESSGMVERLRPNLGYETDEPSVGEMVLDYYRRHFPIGEAFNLRDRYFASLSASSPSSEQGRG